MRRPWLTSGRSLFSRYAQESGPDALEGCDTDKAQRRFSFISMMGFTCTILITWEAELMRVTFFIWGNHIEVANEILSVFTLGLTKYAFSPVYGVLKLLC